MRILLTNDDGPPSASASPYISTFLSALRSHGHDVSVIVPTAQRSWIGKAHLVPAAVYTLPSQQPSAQPPTPNPAADHITPTYYDHTTGLTTSDPSPSPASDTWVLVPGTPAAAVQLGLFHTSLLFPTSPSPPFDLVLSGPNYGRNTSAAFALSSGTLGGALEAATCGVRGIALSFAFFTRQEAAETVEEACGLAVRIVEKLCREWDEAGGGAGVVPDVYNVNVPLEPGVSQRPIWFTWMLDNKGRASCLYQPVEGEGEGEGKPPSFKWAPAFGEVWKVIEQSKPGNDALMMRDRCTSITPLMANYESLFGKGRFEGEFKL